MIATIFLLALIFIAGLLTTSFPSKLLAFFMFTLNISIPNSSSPPDVEFLSKTGSVEKKQRDSYGNKDELKRVFATFDKDGDGSITKQELKQSLKNMGMVLDDKDIEELIWTVDSNDDGLIDLDEFSESFASLLSTNRTTEEEEGEMNLKEAFDVFDEDKDGVITVQELGMVLTSMGFTQGNRLEECSKMIKKVDIDGDGMVNFDEFKKMMKQGNDAFLALA